MTIAERLKALYSKIPEFKCKEGCTDCCGPVPFSQTEYEALPVKRKLFPLMQQLEKGLAGACVDCPYSKNGDCEVHSNRPFICRLFGTVPGMECPHGCKPETMLTDDQGHELIAEYQTIFALEHIAEARRKR